MVGVKRIRHQHGNGGDDADATGYSLLKMTIYWVLARLG